MAAGCCCRNPARGALFWSSADSGFGARIGRQIGPEKAHFGPAIGPVYANNTRILLTRKDIGP